MLRENPRFPLRLWSIRTQIILGFGLILALTMVIVVVNFITLRNLQTRIEATVDEASRLRELGLEIQNQFLLARGQESAFLDDWRALGFELARTEHVIPNQEYLNAAQEGVAQLGRLLARSRTGEFDHLTGEIADLGPALSDYDRAFLATVEQIRERSRAGGLERQLDISLKELEYASDDLPNSGDLIRIVTQMGASEQAYFNTAEQQHVDRLRLLTSQSVETLNVTPMTSWAWSTMARPRVLDMVDEHMAIFNDLQLLESEININTLIFQEVTEDVSTLTNHVVDEGAISLAESRAQLERSVQRSTGAAVAAGVVALGIGLLTAFLLGRRILDPLSSLTDAAWEIGQGNLRHQVSLTGQDEFVTLGTVFNRMARQLHSLVGSLEQAVSDRTRALTTSFEISRRLSTILDRQQLVSEVVDQVRSAFDYYHTQIYLRDERSGDLIMVGGTGDAGRNLLAAGHHLERGHGLVGQAAESGQPVLAPDVRTSPNWVPNPLLPGTRSEAAVPIALGERVLGVLDVQHNVTGGLSQADVDLLQSIANQIAVALQNASLFERAQLKAVHEARVNAINLRIQEAGSVEQVLQIAAQEVGRALGGRRSTVQLRLGSGDGNGRSSTDLQDISVDGGRASSTPGEGHHGLP